MKKSTRLFSFIVALTVMLIYVTACGATKEADKTPGTSTVATQSEVSAETSASTETSAIDLSKEVELQFYLLGPEPKDMALVKEEFNKLSKKDLNCTVNWNFLGWDKWDTKYNLTLSSGEDVDMIYTATWAGYQDYAAKGAFLALDELAPKYAPKSWEGMTKEQWDAAKVKGKIYTVPSDWVEYDTIGIMYRDDLREKYGITKPIGSLEEMEAFFDAAKKADNKSVPFNVNTIGIEDMSRFFTAKYGIPPTKYVWSESYDSNKMISYYDTPEFVKYVETMKRWNEKGFFSKSIMAMNTDPQVLFNEGKTIAITSNPEKANTAYLNVSASHPDWKIGFYSAAEKRGLVHPAASIRNGVAIAKSSKNAERALALIDKLRYDKDYYNLTTYGIENKHYKLEDGKYKPMGTAEEVGFAYQAMQPWGWHVDKMELPNMNQWEGMKPFKEKMQSISKPSKFDAFAFDSKPVSAESAAHDQIFSQYVVPLTCGQVTDINKGIEKIKEKLKSAGYYDKYLPEIQKQVDVYWKEMGY